MNTPVQALSLSMILNRPVTDSGGHRLGSLADLVVGLRGKDYPLVTGLIVAVGDIRVFLPAEDVDALEPGRIALSGETFEFTEFNRRQGELLLAQDVLGGRLTDISGATKVIAYDVQLTRVLDGWAATGLDVHRWPWLVRGPRHAGHTTRDWHEFKRPPPQLPAR